MNKKALRGSLLLLLGSVIWGAAFAAQRAGMDHIGPFTFSGIRMLLAGLVMILLAVGVLLDSSMANIMAAGAFFVGAVEIIANPFMANGLKVQA